MPLLAALIAFTALAFAPAIFNDGDTYWHVVAGAAMLDRHAILTTDPFSYTFHGAPWQAHEWLSEVLMALAYRAGGWGGVALLSACAFALTAGLLCRHLGRWLDVPAQAVVVVLALACMAGSLLARPHLLALPLLEVWVFGLASARSEHRAPHWSLWPAMTLWANMHGGFAFGFAMLALFGLEALIEEPDKRKTLVSWSVFGIGAVLAALLTPHFVQGLLFPLRLMAMSTLGDIGEWQPMDAAGLVRFLLIIVAGLYFLISRGVKLPVMRIAMVLVLLYLALAHERHLMVFAAAVPLILAEPVARAIGMRAQTWRPRLVWVLPALLLGMAIGAIRLIVDIPHGGALVTPQAALAYVPADLKTRPVLNEYGFGGYLIFEGVRPFIDSRAELYGDAFLANYAKIISPDPKALAATIARYDVAWSIFPPSSPVVAMLDRTPGWHRVYGDDIAVVQIRNH
ncbi:MAG TPA: hypothetical protein VFV07_09655 [Rhizomicrobium sp.]|nr:hypothetical protein [Rhizomicrobium sp.]